MQRKLIASIQMDNAFIIELIANFESEMFWRCHRNSLETVANYKFTTRQHSKRKS